MVSFWPWKAADASPASFAKTLSALASKIADSQARLDRTHRTSRRARVLSTLYLSFAYLVYAIVLVLVVGWRHMGALEWSGLAGGPVAIYAVRTLLAAYFNFRIDSLAATLKDQQTEREKTIQKLKDATKYDSTLELLEKYGGDSKEFRPAGKGRKTGAGAAAAGPNAPPTADPSAAPGRVLLRPPPTANIARPSTAPAAVPPPDAAFDVSAEFAPNAFGDDDEAPLPVLRVPTSVSVSGSTVSVPPTPHWYDRILDVLMGEDETAAKNRIVLICRRCRLVNGQAPPGTRSLAEVGSWRCMGCGATNGETAAADTLVDAVIEAGRATDSEGEAASARGAGATDSEPELDHKVRNRRARKHT